MPFRQRLLIALAASLSIHALLMCLPPIQLPQAEPDLPPLIAKLVPLPQVDASPLRPVAHRHTATSLPTDSLTGDAAASTVVATAEQEATAASSPAATASQVVVAASSAVETAVQTAETTAASATTRPILPRHAYLKFQVRIGEDGMAVGEARHELKIDQDHYELTATTRTVGLARLAKSYRLVQHSSGSTDGIVLHPERYSEEKQDDGEQRKDSVQLDYASRQLVFSSGLRMSLKEATQDILSILYQFPPLPEQGDVLPISITNGRDWEEYRFEIATNEELITPLGKLHTVHFRKLHPPGKEGLEIWFAQEYRLLPVKLRHIERDGSIAGEAIITDIRIAED
jgi:hypothetical protein